MSVAKQDEPSAASRPGRPRRFDPQHEIGLLLDSAMKVMRRAGTVDVNVTGILEEAGLSTRSFYRHFSSKDELLLALEQREADRSGAQLVARLEGVDGSLERLATWVDEMLGLVYDRRRAVRVQLLSSEAAQRASSPARRREAFDQLSRPLIELLAAGKADGTFPLAEPESHAHVIRVLTGGLLNMGVQGVLLWDTREQAADHILRFCLPALGVPADRR